MSLTPKDPTFVGIEITPTSFKIAAIKKRGKKWIIPFYQEIHKGEEQKLFEILPKEAILVTSLSSREILVKNLIMPALGEKEVKAAFEFQVEPLLPYPLEKSIVTYEKIGEKEQGSLFTIFAIKKEYLQSHLETWNKILPATIEVVTAPACALKALATQFIPSPEPFFFIHIGNTEGTIAIIENGQLMSSRFFEKNAVEIEKAILALAAAYKKPIETLVLLSAEKQWQETLQKITKKDILYPSLIDLPIPEEQLQKFGLCIGMALGAAMNKASKEFPNFRKKEFQIVFPWKRLKKPLCTFFALFCILFSGSFFLVKTYLDGKEKALYQKFNAFYPKKSISSLAGLEEELIRIEKQVKESPDIFPLLPIVPKLHNFISWISSHTSQSQHQIVIEDLRYHMTKRPDFTKPEEHYHVQIEMIFSAENANVAENIRNLISTPNPFVDTKKGIEWTIEKGKYKTIFTLKDKTHYY